MKNDHLHDCNKGPDVLEEPFDTGGLAGGQDVDQGLFPPRRAPPPDLICPNAGAKLAGFAAGARLTSFGLDVRLPVSLVTEERLSDTCNTTTVSHHLLLPFRGSGNLLDHAHFSCVT